jgi:hypothetical protein
MTEALASIITDLEQRKAAIDRALVALRDIDDNVPGDIIFKANRKLHRRNLERNVVRLLVNV